MDYDTVAVCNGAINQPAEGITRCTASPMSSTAVRCERERGLLMTDPLWWPRNQQSRPVQRLGLMMDLSRMKGVHVDPRAGPARVPKRTYCRASSILRDPALRALNGGLNRRRYRRDRADAEGRDSLVDARIHGATIDDLLFIDLVTADSDFVTAGRGRRTRICSQEYAAAAVTPAWFTSFEWRLPPSRARSYTPDQSAAGFDDASDVLGSFPHSMPLRPTS